MSKKYDELILKIQKTQNEPKLEEILCEIMKNNSDFNKKAINQSVIEKFRNIIKNVSIAEMVQSFNSQTCLDKDTKLVIVGTITPWGGNGYFYTSKFNRVYGILDKFFGLEKNEDSFVNLKKKLNDSKTEYEKIEIIESIKSNLKNRKIAFVDVIKTAIREKNNSNDDKIILYSLDFDTFKNCENVEKFICTSKNTASCLTNIFDNLGFNTNKIVVCPQDRFHYKWEDWENELDKVF